jgi:hypothetical protein
MSDLEIREGEEVPKNEADPAAVQEVTGDKPTLPGQREIVIGSPEHEALLKANPNATSYGPDVNLVQPPEPEPEEEEVQNEDPQEEAP